MPVAGTNPGETKILTRLRLGLEDFLPLNEPGVSGTQKERRSAFDQTGSARWVRENSGVAGNLIENVQTSFSGFIGARMVDNSARWLIQNSGQSTMFRPISSSQDMTWACWVKILAFTGTHMYPMSRWQSTTGGRGWALWYDNTAGLWSFRYSDNGTNVLNLSGSDFGTPQVGVDYLLIGKHDGVAEEVGISVNGAPFQTQAHTTGLRTAPALLGISGNAGNDRPPFDGIVFNAACWRDRAFTDADAAAYYNNGNPIPFNHL